MSTEGSLAFQIHGEDLTRIVRDLVLEDRHGAAARLLVDHLDGMTWDIAYQVLSGEASLVGASPDVHLDPTPDPAYQASLRSLFGGSYRDGDRAWRPHAVVIDFGPHDLEDLYDRGQRPRSQRPKRWTRAAHYADPKDRIEDLRLPELGVRPVIFRSVSIPIWWRTDSTTPQEALDEYLDVGGRLDRRGHSIWYGQASVRAGGSGVRADEEDRNREWEAHIQDLRHYQGRILDQAGPDEGGEDGGWMSLRVPHEDTEEEVYRVPRAPFFRWALCRTWGRHLAPEWSTVCPPGIKLQGDVPDHTDWMLGMLPEGHVEALYDIYQDADLRRAAHRRLFKIQEHVLGFEAAVLSGSGRAEGTVVHPRPDQDCAGRVAVIPHASARYTIPAMTALATITETGGRLAHLAVVGVERGILLVAVPDARTLYPEGCVVAVDCARGRVQINDDRGRS